MTISHSDRIANARFVRPDFAREHRKGVPEIILASNKTVEQCMGIAQAFLERAGRAILSRVSAELEASLRATYGPQGYEWFPASRTAIIRRDGNEIGVTGGAVGVITAGTSDQPIAEEAAIVCREMGCRVDVVYDVGVAGLHRLFEPLRRLLEEDRVDVLIVAAGMDGALPSVVSGLVEVPVIGLPTSVGYGMGGQGHAALLAMLQTCSPGLAVVNIDNGVGAGVMAALIANRVAAARREGPQATPQGAEEGAEHE
jgi:NCAIR mutase (PurE)-related protein